MRLLQRGYRKRELSENEVDRVRDSVFSSLRAIRRGTSEARLHPISEKVEAQVYVVDLRGERLVVKRHAAGHSYRRELVALLMFARIGIAPKVIWNDDSTLSIFMEHCGNCTETLSLDDLDGIARTVAKAHAFASRCASNCRNNGLTWPNMSVIYESQHYQHDLKVMLEEMMKAFGHDYVPSAIGDLKGEHILVRSGGFVFVDLETFSWGNLETVDLIGISSRLLPDADFEAKSLAISEAYCSTRRSLDPSWAVSAAQLRYWLGMMRTLN